MRDQGTGAALLGYTALYGQVPGAQAEFLRVPYALGLGPIGEMSTRVVRAASAAI